MPAQPIAQKASVRAALERELSTTIMPLPSIPPPPSAPPPVLISLSLTKFSCGPFPTLTISLLISASGVDACVPTHGASMNLKVVPVKGEGSDTAGTPHTGTSTHSRCTANPGRGASAGTRGRHLPTSMPTTRAGTPGSHLPTSTPPRTPEPTHTHTLQETGGPHTRHTHIHAGSSESGRGARTPTNAHPPPNPDRPSFPDTPHQGGRACSRRRCS